jgi:hypothetical protein
MTDKSNFTSDEWKLLLEGVMMSSLAVSAAAPSGIFGLLKEGFATGGALVSAKMDGATNALIKAVVADLETSRGRAMAQDGVRAKLAGGKPAEIKSKCIETLTQVSALLDAKAPGDALSFKRWLQGISQRVAEAASEGGVFGFGGVQVSDSEKATLAEIATTLKLAS